MVSAVAGPKFFALIFTGQFYIWDFPYPPLLADQIAKKSLSGSYIGLTCELVDIN